MRILFLPNFDVEPMSADNPSLLSANKFLGKDRYWFFRHLQGVEVEVLDNRAPFPLSAISRRLKIELFQPLKALGKRHSCDMIVSHSYNSGFVFSLMRSLFSERLPPHVVIDIGCLNGGRRGRLNMAVLRFALRSVSGLVYHSSVNESFYSECVPGMKRKLVPYGEDLDFFKPLERPSAGDYALSIGYHKRDYGTLVEAWKKIDFPLRIIGNPGVDTAGLSRIRPMAGMSILELRDQIHDSRFVVLPVEESPYSVGQMTFAQCMAMGKPIVVTDVPGLADYAVDGLNCLKVGPRMPGDIVEKVGRIINDSGLAKSLSSNARKYAVEQLSEARMARGIYEFLVSIQGARNER